MKVQELIARLQEFDQDAEVHFSYNYGDHWRTQVAPKVESVDYGMVEHSAYHGMPKVADDEDSDEEKTSEVIILS